MAERDLDTELRSAAMSWLDRQADLGKETLTYYELSGFEFQGRRVPLVSQQGIWKPAFLDAALSFRTAFTPPSQPPPYQDAVGSDGLLRYKYRGDDPAYFDNVAMRRAYQRQLPLIWLVGVAKGTYLPRYPVWLRGDEPEQLQFAVALDDAQRLLPVDSLTPDGRRYVERLTKMRLHQPVFRARVLHAYGRTCAMCRLRHVQLLDAAHILADTHPKGQPVVPNGLSLCKMHHAAYDQNILGVRPDVLVEVREDILREIDGPMLRHGLQEMDGVRLLLPRSRDARPDPVRLEERYQTFRAAG